MLTLKDDKVLVAGIIGVISTICAEVFSQVLTLMGITHYSLFNLSSMIITLNRPSIIIGLFISTTVGGFLAVILYFVFVKIGSQHLVIKCIGVSIIMWIALELIFTFAVEDKFIGIRPITGYYGHLAGAIVFGIIEGILFNRIIFSKYKLNEN
jgi:predicted tellurium resistance membrane protein TerC